VADGGGFTPDLFADLKSRPEVVRELAHEILAAHFPESLHESIARAVGLDLEGTARSAKRDSAFRGEVVPIWGHQCAFCGFSIKLDSADLAIEAAHIRWVQFGVLTQLITGWPAAAFTTWHSTGGRSPFLTNFAFWSRRGSMAVGDWNQCSWR
jgi:hypothetical protein